MSRIVRATEKERVYGETRSDAIQGLGRASWRDPQCLNLPQPALQLIPTRENAAHQPSLALPGEAPAAGQALNHRRRLQVRTSPPRPPIVAEYASPKPVAAGRPSACRARRSALDWSPEKRVQMSVSPIVPDHNHHLIERRVAAGCADRARRPPARAPDHLRFAPSGTGRGPSRSIERHRVCS